MLAAEDIDGLLDIAHARLGCTGTGVQSCWKKQGQQDLQGQADFLVCLTKLLNMPGKMRQVPQTSSASMLQHPTTSCARVHMQA